jgi:hypothetical protein
MAAFSLGVGGECAPGAGAALAFDAGIGEAEAGDCVRGPIFYLKPVINSWGRLRAAACGRMPPAAMRTRDGALSNRLLSAGKWQNNSTRFCPAASQ